MPGYQVILDAVPETMSAAQLCHVWESRHGAPGPAIPHDEVSRRAARTKAPLPPPERDEYEGFMVSLVPKAGLGKPTRDGPIQQFII